MDFARRLAAPWLGISVLLASCGGGGSSGEPPPPTPPALPSSITVTAPAQADWQTAVAFDSSVVTAAAGWRYDWRFGDGESSTEARPQHSYASAGEYSVALTITDAQGASVAATRKLTVQAWANLRSTSCSRPGLGGWCRIGVESQALPIQAFHVADATQAWLVTGFGDVWRTADAGKTWQALAASGPNGAIGVYFTDAMNGWVAANVEGTVGFDPVIWRTSDGGASFAPALPAQDESLGSNYRVRVLGGKALIAESASARGPSFGSVDGGATWRANPVSATTPPWTLNLSSLPAAGRSGRMWRLNGLSVEASDDAGLTVQTLGSFPASCVYHLNSASLQVAPAGRLMAVTDTSYVLGPGTYVAKVCYSVDGGATWAVAAPGESLGGDAFSGSTGFIGDTGLGVRDDQGNLLLSNPAGAPWQRLPQAADMKSLAIHAVDEQRLWAELSAGGKTVFGYQGDRTFFSSDAGKNWVAFSPASPDFTRSYQFRIQSSLGDVAVNKPFDAQRGLQLRKDKLFRTEDNGVTWAGVTVAGPSSVPVATNGGGVFLTVKQGFVVSSATTLLQTDDGGRSWTTNTTLPAGTVYNLWKGPDQSLLLSGLFTDRGAPEPRLLRSADGGKTWTSVFNGAVLDVQFIGRAQGWLYTGAQVFRSADLGMNWQASGMLSASSMQMLDAQHGVAGSSFYAGSSNPPILCLQTTEDGGANWTACTVPQVASGIGLFGVATGASSFWLFNTSGLHRSKDFGKTWSAVTLPGPSRYRSLLTQLAFADAQRGWALSAQGGIWTTGDGGQTWEFQAAPTSANLRRLSIVDARAVWAFGANTLLGTATGGE